MIFWGGYSRFCVVQRLHPSSCRNSLSHTLDSCVTRSLNPFSTVGIGTHAIPLPGERTVEPRDLLSSAEHLFPRSTSPRLSLGVTIYHSNTFSNKTSTLSSEIHPRSVLIWEPRLTEEGNAIGQKPRDPGLDMMDAQYSGYRKRLRPFSSFSDHRRYRPYSNFRATRKDVTQTEDSNDRLLRQADEDLAWLTVSEKY